MSSILAAASLSLAGVPAFLLYLVASLVLVALFLALYTAITPQPEFRLIRDGNSAAAISLGGALLGFVIPLSKSIAQSHDLVDMVIWSVIALMVQLAVFLLSGLILPHEARRIVEGETAAAILLAAISIGAGFVTAACMTYTP